MKLGSLILCGLLSATSALAAESNWPQFRGPASTGVLESPRLPATWGTNDNVAWKTEIPGSGWSSPIVWGRNVFLTSVVNEGETEPPKKGLYFGGERTTPSKSVHRWMVYCLNLEDGKIVWGKQVHEGAPESTIHVKNTYAAETPVTDGQRVYAYFGNTGLFCLDYQGHEIWQKKWPARKTRYGWGTAASPVLHDGALYVLNDNEEESFLTALDGKTGKELWRVAREEKSNWATPYIWKNQKRTELVVPGRNKVRSYGLDGKLLWEFGGMSTIVIPTPFASSEFLYVCSGYVGDKVRPFFAIRPGAEGDITLKDGETSNAYIAWANKTAAPYNPSPILYKGRLHVLMDFGFMAAFDAATGAELYGKQRINTEGSSGFTASPWAYQDKIFCLSEDGDTFVVEAGPKYKLVGKNSLNEMCMATPAMTEDSLLIRTMTKLYRIKTSFSTVK